MSIASRSASARLFAARARRQRLRRLLTVLGSLVAVVAVGAGAWLIGWSDVLAVRDVRVRGVGEGLALEVLTAAEAPIGTPLARADTSAMAGRVGELPEVADVEVSRSWPDTLTIDVTARTGVAAVSDGESWWSVDESGVVFGESASRPDGLPVLDASAHESARPVRAAGIAVLTGLPSSVRELVDSVQARSEADIRLELADGATVLWGTADDVERKAEVLLALIDAREEPASSYNVSAPDHPAVTP